MTDPELFEPSSTRSFSEVLAAYEAAEDLLEWLRGEIAAFLDNGEGPEDLEARVDAMIEILEDRVEYTQATVLDPDKLLGLEVEVFSANMDVNSTLMLSDVPHPVELLWTVAHYAKPGDLVRVSHHYAGSVVTAARMWPFSVDDAVLLTSPDPRARADEAGAVVSSVEVPAFATAVFAVAATLLGVGIGVCLGRRRR